MIEPTHGIKNQNGDWMVQQDGMAVAGPHRQILATVEQMNRDAQKYESGDSYEACFLPEKDGEGIRRELVESVYNAIKDFRIQWRCSPTSIGFSRDLWEIFFGVLSPDEPPRLWGLTVVLGPEIPTGQFQLIH